MSTLKELIPLNLGWYKLTLTQKLLCVIGDWFQNFSVDQRIEQIHVLMSRGAHVYEWYLNYTNEPRIITAVLQNAHIGSINNFYCDPRFDYAGRVAKWKSSVHAKWRECPQKAKHALGNVLGVLLLREIIFDCKAYVCDRTIAPETDRRFTSRLSVLHARWAAEEFENLYCMHSHVLERSKDSGLQT